LDFFRGFHPATSSGITGVLLFLTLPLGLLQWSFVVLNAIETAKQSRSGYGDQFLAPSECPI